MKGEEFNDYIMEQAASVEGVEINQAALDREPVRDLVNDSTRYGTSSETESSASEESSSETSSAVESSESSASSEVSSESSAAEE